MTLISVSEVIIATNKALSLTQYSEQKQNGLEIEK